MDSLVGKKVTVVYEEVVRNELEGEVVAHDEKGVLLKRLYRKHARIEFIPKEKVISLFHDEKKPRKNSAKAVEPQEDAVKPVDKVTAPVTTSPLQIKEAVTKLKSTVVKDLSDQLSFDDEDESPAPAVEEDDEWGDD